MEETTKQEIAEARSRVKEALKALVRARSKERRMNVGIEDRMAEDICNANDDTVSAVIAARSYADAGLVVAYDQVIRVNSLGISSTRIVHV